MATSVLRSDYMAALAAFCYFSHFRSKSVITREEIVNCGMTIIVHVIVLLSLQGRQFINKMQSFINETIIIMTLLVQQRLEHILPITPHV